LVGAVVVFAALLGMCGIWNLRSEVFAQRPATYSTMAAGGELIAVPQSMGEKGQMLTVLDPRQQSLAVYWIEGATGKVTLRSVRNVHYDLQLMDFNSDNPLPREIRTQLDQR
jgi:hypothetical protein